MPRPGLKLLSGHVTSSLLLPLVKLQRRTEIRRYSIFSIGPVGVNDKTSLIPATEWRAVQHAVPPPMPEDGPSLIIASIFSHKLVS